MHKNILFLSTTLFFASACAAQDSHSAYPFQEDPRLDEGLYYELGSNATGEVPLSGILSPIAHLAGVPVGTPVPFLMAVPIDVSSATLGFALPGHRRINEVISYEGMLVYVTLPAAVSVWLNLYIKPSPDAPQFAFTAMGSASPLRIDLSASSEQQWQDVFGIKGLTIDALGCGVGLTPVPNPPFVIPSKFALTGRLSLGATVVHMAVVAAVPDMSEIGLYGKIQHLRLSDMMLFAAHLIGKDFPKNTLPEITVQENELLIAPNMFVIGGIFFERGFVVKNSLVLFGKKISNKFIFSDRGLISHQYTDPLDMGVIHIKGNGPAGGPELNIELTLDPQFKISGEVTIGSHLQGKTDIHFSKNRASFELQDTLRLDAKTAFGFTVKGSGPADAKQAKIKLSIAFDDSLASYLRQLVMKKLGRTERFVRVPIEIERISFTGTPEEVAQGILPRLLVRLKIGSIYKELYLEFNLGNPRAALTKMVDRLAAMVNAHFPIQIADR